MSNKLLYYSTTSLSDDRYRSSLDVHALGMLPDARMPVDRARVFSNATPIALDYYPHEIDVTKRVNLDAVMYDAARKIYNQGRPVYLLWSGGIDSTAAAVALLQHRNSYDPPVTFVFNEHSVEEYSDFALRLYSSHYFCHDSSHYRFLKYLPPDGILTSGDCGDQLQGSRRMLQLNMPFNEPYQSIYNVPEDQLLYNYDSLPPALQQRYSISDVYRHLINLLPYVVEQAPLNIVTVFDLFWYLNWRFKYHHVRWKILTYVDGTAWRPDLVKRYNPFYNTPAFQHWSVLNHWSDKHLGNEPSYKWALKEYIVRYTKDSTYRLKRKESSMPRIRYDDCKIETITRIYENGTIESYKEKI